MLRDGMVAQATLASKLSSAARRGGKPSSLAAHATAMLRAHVKRGEHVCVGLSGGIDSVVLLDVLTRIAPAQRWKLSAIHVNHQLNPRAAEWARFCRRLCRALDVPLKVVKVNIPRGDSIEAAAREARYAAYRAQPARNIVLAQHQDDQAETVLLQLLRGAGVKGVAAMPAMRRDRVRADLKLLRPLLGVTRADIERYAHEHDLNWIEDDSNDDPYYLRNFLRRDILPRIEARVPAYRATLARAAAQAAEASALLDALAAIDAGEGLQDNTLVVASLRELPEARARNLLRYFLAAQGVRMPDARQLNEALRQVVTAKRDAQVRVDIGRYRLYRFCGRLHVVPEDAEPMRAIALAWRGERRLTLTGLGVLEMRRCRGAGIDLAKLLAQPVSVRLRRGGEKLQPDAARPRRPVKDWLQMHGVPPWQRERLPFLWSGERLVWVAGLGVDCAFGTPRGGVGVLPIWHENELLGTRT